VLGSCLLQRWLLGSRPALLRVQQWVPAGFGSLWCCEQGSAGSTVFLLAWLMHLNALTHLMMLNPGCRAAQSRTPPTMKRAAGDGVSPDPHDPRFSPSALSPGRHCGPSAPCPPATGAEAIEAPSAWSPLPDEVATTLCFEMMSWDSARDVRPPPVTQPSLQPIGAGEVGTVT